MKTFNTFNRVYKITNSKSNKEKIETLNSFDPIIQREIYNFAQSIKVLEVDDFTEIAIMNDYEFERYSYYNNLLKVGDRPTDITDDIILGNLFFEEYITNVIINPFLENELNVDMILDKINIKGLENLTLLDHKVLKA